MPTLESQLKILLGRLGESEKKIRELSVLETPGPYNYQGDLNPVVNGNMSVNQRVTAVTVTPSGTPLYTLDQWKALVSATSLPVVNVSQQAMPTNETAFVAAGEVTPTNFLRWAQTTTGSGATFTLIRNFIENVLLFAGMLVTLSFWAKSSVAGSTLGVSLIQNATGGATSAVQTFNLTTAWKKYTYQVTLSNLITAIASNSSLIVNFDFQPNTIQTVDITNVQLDRGSIAAPFKVESLETTLRRCQRYYEKSFALAQAPIQNFSPGSSQFQLGIAGAVARNIGTIWFRVSKRVAPTVTFYNPGNTNSFARNFTAVSDATATSANPAGENSIALQVTGIVGWAVGDVIAVQWVASAEI